MEAERQVMATTARWLAAGRAVTWVTVARTFGASPRPVGAMMAMAGGEVVGSVSGGCVEDDLLAEFGATPPARPVRREFGVSTADAARRGLPCGGRLVVVCEHVTDPDHASAILEAMAARRHVSRRLDLVSGRATLGEDRTTALSDDALVVAFPPPWRMVLTGAGALSQHVVTMALRLGYLPEVIEPRASFRRAWPIADCPVISALPDDYLAEHPPDRHTVVLALTHDMKIDDLLLIEALPSEAFYIGALGSVRTQAARRSRLTEHFDLRDEDLARLHGPVGIDLGSREPAAIAVSILAEVTAERNGITLSAARTEAPRAGTTPASGAAT